MSNDINFFAKAKALRAVAAVRDPPISLVREVGRLIEEPAFASAFFDGLSHPGWLHHLLTGGFGARPDLDHNVLNRFEDYLGRLARQDRSHLSPVFDAWEDMSSSVRAAAVGAVAKSGQAPDSGALPKVAAWFEENPGIWSHRSAEEILRTLASTRAAGAFNKILAAHIRAAVKDESDSGRGSMSDTSAYMLKGLLTKVALPYYAEKPNAGRVTLEARLREYLRLARRSRIGTDVVSKRSAVSDSNQDFGESAGQVVFASLRDLMAQWVVDDPQSARDTVSRYLRGKGIFRRLAIHLLPSGAEAYTDMTASVLLDPRRLDETEIHHEVFVLLRDGARFLSSDERKQLIETIIAGPIDLEDQVARWARWTGEPAGFEQVAHRLHLWSRDRLWMLKDDPVIDIADLLAPLTKRYGEPPHPPEFRMFVSAGTWGEKSPLTNDQAAAMSADELLDFVTTWEPTSRSLHSPSAGGLAKTLRAKTTESPVAIMKASRSRLARLDRSYLYQILQGLEDGIKQDRLSDWQSVGRFLAGVRDYPHADDSFLCKVINVIEESLSKQSWQDDSFTTVTKRFLTDMLTGGIRVDDRDPFAGPTDPVSVALNSVRPRALMVAFKLAAAAVTDSKQPVMSPWLRRLVTSLVDNSESWPAALRCVFGMYVAHLVWYDEVQADMNLEMIFPEHAPEFWDAWSGYSYVEKTPPTFRIMRRKYEWAIDNVGTHEPSKTDRDGPVEALGGDLASAFLAGLSEEEIDSDNMLLRFLRNASAAVRGRTAWTVYRILEDQSLDEPVWQRVRELTRARLNFAKASGNAREFDDEMCWLTAWLCGAGRTRQFHELEALLLQALPFVARAQDHVAWAAVESYAVQLAASTPDQALALLKELIRQVRSFQVFFTSPELRASLEIGVDAGGSAAADAKWIAGFLGEHNIKEFEYIFNRVTHSVIRSE